MLDAYTLPERAAQHLTEQKKQHETYMRIAIIDDMPSAIDGLTKRLEDFTDATVVGHAANGTDGMQMLKRCRPDVVFLDVEMPDMTGLEFMARMKEEGLDDTLTVIYTAFDSYTLPALRNRAFDFLLKPVDPKELETIMERLDEEIENIRTMRKRNSISLSDDGTPTRGCAEDDETVSNGALCKKDDKLLLYTNAVDFRLVMLDDICVFQYNHDLRLWEVLAAGCDAPIRLKRCANKDILTALDESFVQVNQKFIINIKYLMEVKDNMCAFFPPFDGIKHVKIGRMYRRKLIKRFNTI